MPVSYVGLCLLVATLHGASVGAAASSSSPVQERLEALVSPWSSDDAPGVAVGVLRDGQVIYRAGAGLADLGFGVPIEVDTVFHAASVTKQFTAFAVLTLVAAGDVSLEDDIRSHLPDLAYAGPPITIQHLLDHMSGLREASSLAQMAGWRPDDVFTEAQRLALLSRQVALNFAPGAEVEYSNSGYALLAALVEKLTGQSFRAFLQQTVFDRLGMDRSHLRTDLTEVIADRARSYAPARTGFVRRPLNYEIVGSTGLQTTVSDLLLWAKALNEGALAPPEVHELMEVRSRAADGEPSVFGRGQESRIHRGLQTWSHGGTDAGFKSFLMRIPDENFAVAILSNRADFDTAELAFAIVDTLFFDGPEPLAAFDPASPTELASFAGDYELFPGTIFTITTDGETLFFATLGAEEGAPLPQVGDREFLLDPARNLSLVFDPPVDGRSGAFSWTIGLHGALDVPRVKLDPFDSQELDLNVYEGRFRSPELGIEYRIEAIDTRLVLHHHRLPSTPLNAYQTDTFQGEAQVGRVVFVRDGAGRVDRALFSSPLADDVVFDRVFPE